MEDLGTLGGGGFSVALGEKTALIHAGLEALIARESARRLAALGGTEPRLEPAPRRRGQKRRPG